MAIRWPSVLVVAAIVVASFPSSARAQELPPFGGTYVFAGGETQRSALTKAIDDVIAQMNVVMRSLAQKQLHERISVAPRMIIRTDGGRIHIEHAPLPPRTVSVNGTPLPMRNLVGDRVNVTYRMDGGALVEVIAQGRSSQTNRYRISPDGSQISFEAAIRSPVLPAVIRYRLTYRRQA